MKKKAHAPPTVETASIQYASAYVKEMRGGASVQGSRMLTDREVIERARVDELMSECYRAGFEAGADWKEKQ